MTLCSAVDCKNTGIHIFPKDIKRRKQWIKALRRKNWEPTKYSRLCADHFKTDDYFKENSYTGDENKHKVLKKNAVPSIFSFTKRKVANPLAQQRSDRLQERSKKKLCFETADDPIPGPSGVQSINKHEAQFRDAQLPVQMEIDIQPHIQLLGNDQPCSSAESKTTQVDFEHIYGSIQRYKDKDSVLAFYTGHIKSREISLRKMAPQKVLIVNKTYPAVGLEILKNNGLETTVLPVLDYYPESLPEIKKSLVNGYDALIWNTKHKLNAEILDLAGARLKSISTMSSGLDHVDLDEVKRRGIPLGNTLQVLDDTVADITVGLLVAAARRFKEGIEEVATGNWKYGVQWRLGQDVAGSTVGIIGFGGIGQAVARRLRGFDVARFLYSGRSDKPEAKALNAKRVPIDQLLKESDFVVICCPLTSETKHLINADSLKTMKKTSVLVNIARGGVVDTEALYVALKENWIFSAGLDVIDPEPISKDHPIVSLPNCFLVPHVGSATVGCRNKMATITANNIIAGLQGKPMECPAL